VLSLNDWQFRRYPFPKFFRCVPLVHDALLHQKYGHDTVRGGTSVCMYAIVDERRFLMRLSAAFMA